MRRGVLLFVLLAIVLANGSVALAHEDNYPMPAADYRTRTETRLSRYKERIEQHMTDQKLDAAKREVVRKRVAAIQVEVRALVEQHAKDGTITAAEAGEIKDRSKKLREALYREFQLAPDKKPSKAKPIERKLGTID